jgi:hypothetical protein
VKHACQRQSRFALARHCVPPPPHPSTHHLHLIPAAASSPLRPGPHSDPASGGPAARAAAWAKAAPAAEKNPSRRSLQACCRRSAGAQAARPLRSGGSSGAWRHAARHPRPTHELGPPPSEERSERRRSASAASDALFFAGTPCDTIRLTLRWTPVPRPEGKRQAQRRSVSRIGRLRRRRGGNDFRR